VLWILSLAVVLTQEQRSDSIVAIVNDEVITYGEVASKINESVVAIEQSNMPQREKEMHKKTIFQERLRQLVDNKLILQEAKRYNIKISEENIRQQIEKVMANRDDKKASLEEVDLTDLVRNRLTLQELFQKKTGYSPEEKRRAALDIYVSPQEMHEAYQKNIAQFTKPSKIKTRIITLYYYKYAGGREEAIDNAKAIIAQWREGAGFAQLAKLHSHDPYAKDGGSWPRLNKGKEMVWDFFGKGEALFAEAEEIAFSLKEGEVSQPIPVDAEQYCQIIKIEAMQTGGTVPFEEVQESIQQQLHDEKLLAALTLFIERLRQRAFIWPPYLLKR
jgi:parvulin-like peptidyl-prolyl isomerase